MKFARNLIGGVIVFAAVVALLAIGALATMPVHP